MKRLNRYGWLLAILLLPAAVWAQDAKLAAVDMGKAVLKSAAGDKANKELEAKYKQKTEEFDGKKKELEELNQKMKVQGPYMTVETRNELGRKIDEADKAFKRGLEDTDIELDKLRADSINPIIKAAKEELNKLIAEKGYELVIDISGEAQALFPYVNEKINITDELIKRIDAVIKTTAVADLKPGTSVESKPEKPK